MELRAETKTYAETPYERSAALPHNHMMGFSIFPAPEDGEDRKWVTGKYAYEYYAPGSVDEEATREDGARRGSRHGAHSEFGEGSGTTVVVTQSQAPQDPGALGGAYGHGGVSGAGVDGVVSNIFAKEELVKVDANPNLRKDLCCESYSCMWCCTGGHAWFFKVPDCLGAGSSCMCFLGECAGTCKILQKPTFCECLGYQACIDLSTCCSDKGEGDMTCCIYYTCQSQCTWCCLCQSAQKMTLGIMRTLCQLWAWVLICDWRCGCPPQSATPLQCTLCGFGWRAYSNDCVFRMRADTQEDQAPPPSTNTTVVVATGGNTTVVAT